MISLFLVCKSWIRLIFLSRIFCCYFFKFLTNFFNSWFSSEQSVYSDTRLGEWLFWCSTYFSKEPFQTQSGQTTSCYLWKSPWMKSIFFSHSLSQDLHLASFSKQSRQKKCLQLITSGFKSSWSQLGQTKFSIWS